MAMLLQRVDMKMTHLHTPVLTAEKHISWSNRRLTIGVGQIEFSLDLGFVKACVNGFIQIAGSNCFIFFQLGGGPSPSQPAMAAGGLGDLFSLSGGVGMPGGMYSAPKQVSYGSLMHRVT